MKKMFFVVVVFFVVFLIPALSFAVPFNYWNGTNSGNWSDGGNWNRGIAPGSTGSTTNTDTATFNNAGNNNTAIVNDLNRNLQFIAFDTPSAAACTIGTSGGNQLFLTSGATIQTTASVANIETINAPLVLEGTFTTSTFSSNAASPANALNFGGVIGAAGPGWIDLALTGTNTGNNTISGVIWNYTSTGIYIVKSGAGTWVLSGANTYSGGTTITTGTLKVGNKDAFGTGNVTNNATLDVGTTALTITRVYTQNAGSTLKLIANSSTNFGSITTTPAAVIDPASKVSVNVGGYIPNGASLTVLNTGGAVTVPGTITSSNQYLTFTGAASGNNLVLIASRSGANSFSGTASNSNSAAVGAVLDNITNPSTDMTTVLTALGNLSPSQVASSENSLSPTVDGGVTQSSTQMLNQFTNNLTSHLENAIGGTTGISTGDDYLKGVDIWAQGLGDYAHQASRGLSNGYNATTWGVSGGADMQVYNDSNRIGLGSGYGQAFVRSKDSDGKTDIDSIPAILYYSYGGTNYPVYLDAAFAFVYNSYTGSRKVSVGTMVERTANSDYNGQQYSGYLEGGYSFFYKNLRMTPLVSFQYMHLHTSSYNESGAGALDLSVAGQDYDMAQTGLGAKLAYPIKQKWGDVTPDLHAKWLYDWIGDSQATTANFAGGGTAFGTQGFNPAQSTYDFGIKLGFKTKYNVTIGLDYDFLFKEDYYEHYGIADVKYSF